MQHSSDPVDPAARLHLDGFLARYSGGIRDLYAHHLAGWERWCTSQGVQVLNATRVHIEAYARYLADVRGNKPSTIVSALSPIRSFYRLAHADGLIGRDPAAHAYRPRVHHDPQRVSLDRLELMKWLSVSATISPRHHALAHLLGVLALRTSEAAAVRIEDYQAIERGHRVLRVVGKGAKPATMPLTIPVLRALDAARGDRSTGPLLTTRDGRPLSRHGITSLVDTITRRAGIDKHVTPHAIRASAITAALDAGVPLRDVQDYARHADPKTTRGYDRNRGSLDRHAAHVVSAFLAT